LEAPNAPRLPECGLKNALKRYWSWSTNKTNKHVIIELAPDKPEDLGDIEQAREPSAPVVAEPKIGRNELCLSIQS
jgi:hypothetical protein